MSDLLIHVDCNRITSREDLKKFTTPAPRSDRHKPIPHFRLAQTLVDVLNDQGYTVVEEEYGANDKKMFGIMRLNNTEECVGFRHANDGTISNEFMVGRKLTVCDNLVFSGGAIIMKRKHTINLDLEEELQLAVIRFKKMQRVLSQQIESAQLLRLTTAGAKAQILDLMINETLPKKFIPIVHENYFNPPGPDCEGRTLWSLHNACTRAIRELPMRRKYAITSKLGALLDA
jgi:hypothetical protein